jgi:hypothetical protein
LIKNCKLLIPRPPKRTPKLQEKPSALKREHPALQKMKILSFFQFFWVIFALLDPDPDPAAQINAAPSGSGSGTETLILRPSKNYSSRDTVPLNDSAFPSTGSGTAPEFSNACSDPWFR